MANDIHKRIRELYRMFSKGYKRIANLVLHDYNSVVAITSKEFATRADVSESTVIRFVHSLGYSKYSDFQTAISDVCKIKSNSLENLFSSNSMYQLMDFANSVIKSDALDLKWTTENLDSGIFTRFTTLLIKAKRVFVISNEEMAAITTTLAEGLRYTVETVVPVTNLYSEASLLPLTFLTTDDCVIAIDYPPHSKRFASLLEYISEHTQNILVVSDTKDSPACSYSGTVIVTRTHPVSCKHSVVALSAIVDAILSDVSRRNESQIIATIEKIEALKERLNNNSKGRR